MYRNGVGKLILGFSLAASLLIFWATWERTSVDVVIYEEDTPRQINELPPINDTALESRIHHAEALWAQAVADRKRMISRVGRNRRFPDGYIDPFNVWDFARPSFYCPHDLERIGTIGDGGKIVCGMTRYEMDPRPGEELIVYSFGVKDDSTFEEALLNRTKAQIWGYDYSVKSWAKQIKEEWLERAKFSSMGISGTTNLGSRPPMSTIQDLMAANGHDHIDLIKMDIEGAEFDALTSLIEHVRATTAEGDTPVLPIGQLLVEIHFGRRHAGFSVPDNLTEWLRWWSALEELGFRAVNNEANRIGDAKFGRPRFMEYTLINPFDVKNKLLRG